MDETRLWLFTAATASVGSLLRIGVLLYGKDAPQPPDDLVMLGHWRRRRRWIVISEIFACPSVVAAAVLIYPARAPELALTIGVSGSGLFITGVQARLRRFFGIPDHD